MSITFSIITITKGNPQGFWRTKASVEAQDYTGYEWIVIDGDKEPDAGIYDAMNKGIDRACGNYLIFMNAGDVFAAPDVLTRVAASLKNTPDFIYGDAYEGPHYKPARHDIRAGMITHHQAMFYRRGSLRYDLKYRIAADYKFTIEAIQAANILYLPFAICVFEEGGVSQRKSALGQSEQQAIRLEFGIPSARVNFMQIAARWLKRVFPSAYWALRSRLKTSRAYRAR